MAVISQLALGETVDLTLCLGLRRGEIAGLRSLVEINKTILITGVRSSVKTAARQG
jgi:hypothetical protein